MPLNSKKIISITCLFMLLCCGAVLFQHLTWGDDFYCVEWADRDMSRSADLINEFQTTGAELAYGAGARLPGGALHYVMALPMAFSDDPAMVHAFMLGLNFLAVALMFLSLRKSHGLLAAVVASAAYLTCENLYDNIYHLWNPGFLPLFTVSAYLLFMRTIRNGKGLDFFLFVFFVFLAVQMHLSAIFILLAAVICLCIFHLADHGISPAKAFAAICSTIFLIIAGAAAALFPHIADEAINDFPNTRLFFLQKHLDMIKEGNTVPIRLHYLWNILGQFKGMTTINPEKIAFLPLRWLLELAMGLFTLLAGLFMPILFGVGLLKKFDSPVLGLSREQARSFMFVATAMLIGGLYFAFDPIDILSRSAGWRYVFYLLPAFCIMAGIAFQALADKLADMGHNKAVAALCLLAMLSIGWLSVVTIGHFEKYRDMKFTHSYWNELFNNIKAETSWPIEQVAGRVQLAVYAKDTGIAFSLESPIAYRLHRAHRDYPGSLDSPGAIYIINGKILLDTDQQGIDKILKQSGQNLIYRHHTFFNNDLFITYDRKNGKAYTSFSNRYRRTGRERLIDSHMRDIKPGGHLAVVYGKDEQGIIANLGSDIYIYVQLEKADGNTRAVLHSNQLRGHAHGSGKFHDGTIVDPILVWKNIENGSENITSIATGVVGRYGVFTPLGTDKLQLKPGKYSLTFKANVVNRELTVKDKKDVFAEKIKGEPVSIGLGEVILSGN